MRDPKVTGETIEVHWFPARIITLVIFIGVLQGKQIIYLYGEQVALMEVETRQVSAELGNTWSIGCCQLGRTDLLLQYYQSNKPPSQYNSVLYLVNDQLLTPIDPDFAGNRISKWHFDAFWKSKLKAGRVTRSIPLLVNSLLLILVVRNLYSGSKPATPIVFWATSSICLF